MQNKPEFIFMKPEITITVFQALTLLVTKYRSGLNNNEIYQKIMFLYLSGVRSNHGAGILDDLLDDPCLAGFTISFSKKDINDDPVRRYFESHLSHKTLITSLDFLDAELLELHLDSIVDRIAEDARPHILKKINNESEKISVNEYSEGIRHLSQSDSFPSFKPYSEDGRSSPDATAILEDRKKKMGLIAKCMYAAMHVDEQSESGEVLLDIYRQAGSVYDPAHRGRKGRRDPHSGDLQSVHPHTLGIMRSFMPLPMDDALFSEEPAKYTRAADRTTYKKGSFKWPNQTFASKVTPFVNSISGTMLIKLRVIAQLLRDQAFVYKTPEYDGCDGIVDTEQLTHYLRSFIAYMLYHTGGHSLDEYVCVMQLPEVQSEFRQIPGFSSITLNNLFKDGNVKAFDEALSQTIQYNNNFLNKKYLHYDLKINDKLTSIIQDNLKSTRNASAMVGIVTLPLTRSTTIYSIIDPSIISAALLLVMIRLLNDSPLPPRRHDDVTHRLKQLFLVAGMVIIAKMVGAKIIKERTDMIESDPISRSLRLSPFIASITDLIMRHSIISTSKHGKRHQTVYPSKLGITQNEP